MITIMLVDDHPVIRRGLRAVLEVESDFQVIGEAGDGLEAVSLAQSLRPNVMLLDLMMKGINGIEVARQLSRRSVKLGIIIFSVLGSEHYVLEALRAGALGYVLKDAPSEELVTAVRKVADGDRYLCAPLQEQPFLQQLSGGDSKDWYHLLTTREREVLQLSVQGNTCSEVAGQLGISRRTVESHRANMMRKLGLSSLAGLYHYALQNGTLLNSSEYSVNGEKR